VDAIKFHQYRSSEASGSGQEFHFGLTPPLLDTPTGLVPSSPTTGYEVFRNSINADPLLMGAVESSIYDNFAVRVGKSVKWRITATSFWVGLEARVYA
jgi:hypothetical protein